MELNAAALKILKERYLEAGETPEDMFRRVAEAVAGAESPEFKERYEEAFFEMMTSLNFLPNTPTLMNAGRKEGQLSACFVLPIEDSMHGIFSTLYDAAMIQKSGGGVGFSFSRLRPKGTLVSSTRGVSSGPISFMRIYNAASAEVEQGGARRGANMGVMHITHPDISDFITCKDEEGVLENFNISVALSDSFMSAVKDYEQITLNHGGKTYESVSANDLLDLIAKQAWKNGEPGVLFIDTINEKHPGRKFGTIESTNPCGEQPLLPYESCNLGSINLANMVDENGAIDYGKLKITVAHAVRFLDNVIDINHYPLDSIREATLRTRKIGLGVMGWGTALCKMGIPYDSDQAISIAHDVMRTIHEVSYNTSIQLSRKKGGSARRNITLNTIAPTGSLATIAGVSYGIEPLFGLTYQKRMVDQVFTVVDEGFDTAMRSHKHYDDIMERVKETGSCQDIDEVPRGAKDLFKTGAEIPWRRHLRMQAAFQRYTDNAVSKTINMPHDSTPEDFREAILTAYEYGCKGLTLYRDRSRSKEAVSIGTKKAKLQFVQSAPTPRKRPDSLTGITERKMTPLGHVYMTLNMCDGVPFEFFTLIGKAGSDLTAFTEAIARLVSLALRCGIDPKTVGEQLIDIGGVRGSIGFGPNRVKSVPDAMGQFILGFAGIEDEAVNEANICPGCGAASLVKEKGCIRCNLCQFKEC